jgi:hypothetical protein
MDSENQLDPNNNLQAESRTRSPASNEAEVSVTKAPITMSTLAGGDRVREALVYLAGFHAEALAREGKLSKEIWGRLMLEALPGLSSNVLEYVYQRALEKLVVALIEAEGHDAPEVDAAQDNTSLAEKTLCALVQAFQAQYAEARHSLPLPYSLDLLAFACLLVVSEHTLSHQDAVSDLIRDSREMVLEDAMINLDGLPWIAMVDLIEQGQLSKSTTRLLLLYLCHQSSSIRGYSLNLAWILRTYVPVEQTVPVLLKNVADTLMYVEMSLALAREICGGEDEFWKTADAFEPEPRFASQYRARIQEVKSRGLLHHLKQPFLQLELDVPIPSPIRKNPRRQLGDECCLGWQ